MILKGPGLLPDDLWPARESLAAHRYIQLSDGERVRLVESGASDGPPVLFLHGWGASAYQFRRNLIPIGAAGHRAIAVDLRGHGLSDKPLREGAYTLEAMHAHVVRILDFLELDRVSLIGQSMSGRIALEVALAAPQRVERIALIDSIGLGELRVRRLLPVIALPVIDPIAPHLARRAVIRLALRALYGNADRLSEEDVEEYWSPARIPSFARAMVRLLREFSWELLAEERLRQLQPPALVMFGTLDRLIRANRGGALLQPREGYAVRYLEGAGHVGNEELADEVNELLLAFLSDEALPPPRIAPAPDPAGSSDGEGASGGSAADEPRGSPAPVRAAGAREGGDERTGGARGDDDGRAPSGARSKRRRRKLRQRRADEES